MLFSFIKNRGWREAANALVGALVVGALIAAFLALTGCASMMTVNAEYEHHSSIPDYYDRNTTDQVGVCVDHKLGKQEYAPSIEGCVSNEIGGKEVFGSNPVGTLRLKQPLFIGNRR